MNPQDRLKIEADEVLWRRLTTPDWIKRNSDGTKRVSSAAFKGHEADIELSTHITRLTSLEWVFSTEPNALGVGEILAPHPQELGLEVEHAPEPSDYSHCVIHLSTIYGVRKKHAKIMASKSLLREPPH